MKRMSLRRMFMLGATLGIVLPAMVFGTFWARDRYEREVATRVRVPMMQYADVLSEGLAVAIWNVDREVAMRLVQAVMRNPEVVRVQILDEFHEPFAESSRLSPLDGHLLTETREIAHGSRLVGFVRIELSTARIENEILADLRQQALALMVQLAASLLLIMLLFESRLLHPLRKLQDGANRMARGDLSEPLALVRNDEIGELAQDLDAMRSRLASVIGELDGVNATLEQRVHQRTEELEVAMARLQNAHEELVRAEKLSALGSLVAGVAHELNTPIGNSLTVASTLQDHLNDFVESSKDGVRRTALDQFIAGNRHGTEILLHSLSKAVELIASFKQVAVDQTSVNRRRFDLKETIEEIVLTLGPTFRKQQHSMAIDIPEGIALDSYPGPLGQILTNLINNALVHGLAGRQDGHVRICARRLPDERVEIVVEDDGCGIAPENIGRIFDPFFTTKLGQGGSGLGLNIVYNLVTGLMGGEVTVRSLPGQGAQFTLRLPLVAPREANAEEAECAPN